MEDKITFLVSFVLFISVLGGYLFWLYRSMTVYIQKARIATDLVKLYPFKKHSKVRVLGYSMHCYLDDNYEHWRALIEKWVCNGVEITYLVQNYDESIKTQLEELHVKLKDMPGKLKILHVKKNEENRELLKACETHHWVLFEHPRRMWVEGHHPIGETYAEDCEFVKRPCKDVRYNDFKFVTDRFEKEAEVVWSE